MAKVDVERALTGGNSDTTDDATSVSIESLKILQRAVVIDVLDNRSLATSEYTDKLIDEYDISLNTIEDLGDAPRNAILGQLVTLGEGRSSKPQVFFPFFSSHFVLPCKPGEQVWVVFEDPANARGRGYWMTRVNNPIDVEDVNYAHYDRFNTPTSPEEAETWPGPAPNPGFPNGATHTMDMPNQRTLPKLDAFKIAAKDSLEANDFIIEPVPRLTKRPGDLVLQGSNNATIVLGTDRGYRQTDTVDQKKSNAHLEKQLKPGHGAIDMVVGRGRGSPKKPKNLVQELDKLASSSGLKEKTVWPQDPKTKLLKPPGKPPERTMPAVVQNSRQTFETDKNPALLKADASNSASNASEGDPDFFMDAARVYLTMTSNGDEDFGLSYPKFTLGQKGKDPVQPKDVTPKDAAFVITKSDEIRLVARQNKDKKIDGSIRIVKEGKLGDDQCVITLLPGGTVAIDAKKIIIGDGADGRNLGIEPDKGQTFIGEAATEPIVLGNQLKTMLDKFFDDLKLFLSGKYDTHVHPTGVGPSGPPAAIGDDGGTSSAKAETEKFLSKVGKIK